MLLLLVSLGVSPAAGRAAPHSVEILIPGLPQPVRLAPADAEAFQRRLNAPPSYAGPLPSGEAFTVTTDYWDFALGTGADGLPTDAPGTYFPSGGIVRLRQMDRDAYYVLDLRQRALLDRYIRLAKAGSLQSSTPGALEVLVAAAGREPISIELPGGQLPNDAARLLWRSLDEQAVAVTFLEPPAPPSGEDGYWITFTTVEGRALQYFYEPTASRLTDVLGSETYTIRNILPGSAGEPRGIEQQEPRGSALWWPLMLGGGMLLLGAATLLHRRQTRR
jgi:hypothetical protein